MPTPARAFGARVEKTRSARPNVRMDGLDFQSIPFDLENLFDDVYRQERQWFMDRTQALRDRLDAEDRARVTAEALRVLPGHLEGIWSGGGSAAARRRRLFDVWDDTADDPTGRRARAIVLRFIRERLPEGGADAYPPSELRRLNASRDRDEAFDPYRAPP